MDDQAVIERLRALRLELKTLSASARDSLKPVALDQQSVGRLSRMDSLQVQAMDQAAEQRRRRDIVRIDAALTRARDGDYGYCASCDEKIGARRLALDPATPLCIQCAR